MKRLSVAWIAVGIIFVWLFALTLYVERQAYYVRMHDLQLRLQIGMTRQQADRAWGSPPLLIDIHKAKLPRPMRGFTTGQLVRYSELIPSSYMYVHFGKGGKIDLMYFHPS